MRFFSGESLCSLLIGFALLATPTFLLAEEPPTPDRDQLDMTLPAAIRVQAGGSEPSTGVSAALLEIRARLGFNPLEGTVLDGGSASSGDFAAEVKRLDQVRQSSPRVWLPPTASSRTVTSPVASPRVSVPSTNSLPGLSPQHVNELPPLKPTPATADAIDHPRGRPLPEAYSVHPGPQASYPALRPRKIATLTADPSLVTALRTAARELDRKANDHETSNHYVEADFLREEAHRLRDIARRHAAAAQPPTNSASLPSPR